MRVYELYFWTDEGPFRTWYSSKAKLMTALAGYRRDDPGQPAQGWLHEIPTNKAGLIDWLNGHADSDSISNPVMETSGRPPTPLPDVQ